jgi:putative flippase GtrA
MATAWVAIINGQPLYLADTSAYVRGPDFAVVYSLGNKFATSWTQSRTLQGRSELSDNAVSRGAQETQNASLDSPFDRAILAGRSIYYGALLYIGHLTSYMWLSVFVQGAIFLYLCNLFLTKCLRLSFFTSVCATSTLLVTTPVSFFISFLMPDIFAAFLILASAILLGFWRRLSLLDKILLEAVIAYSALTHTSHLLLLACLAAVFAVTALVAKRYSDLGSQRAIVILAIIFIGVLGEFGFSYAIKHEFGSDPVRPPFLMARTIADGPGYEFLQKNCATKPYVVCNYIDHFPEPALAFLWSIDPNKGVFSVADLDTRNKLSSEQSSFLIDVFRFDPLGVTLATIKNSAIQFVTVRLREFFPSQQEIDAFRGKLPENYFKRLSSSRIIFHNWIMTPGDLWFSSIYFVCTLGLLAVWIFWPFINFDRMLKFVSRQEAFQILTLTMSGVIFNAVICGALSEPVPRYQTRVSWIPVFLVISICGVVFESLFSVQNNAEFARGLAERLPRPLRFLGIGGIGLIADLGAFTIVTGFGVHPLIARLCSLAIATFVTWRLNRELTFDRSGRRLHDEAVRYSAVTIMAQGTSYGIFATLILTVLKPFPQLAIIIGAAVGAAVSYNGHRLLSFAPRIAQS